MENLGHGQVGTREKEFSTLLPLRVVDFDVAALAALAADMKGGVDTVKDGPDPEENILVPAGYTYFGQFIDHDLTFDSTSSLISATNAEPSNVRTPRFDLDCVYGDGPDAQPYLYDPDGQQLLFKNDPANPHAKPTDLAAQDLMRNPNGRAIIGDKRNDENSIVSQIQLSFIKYHNAVVAELKKRGQATWSNPQSLFVSARNEVRWTYQRLVVEDFLPRIVRGEVFQNLQGLSPDVRAKNYALYTEDKRWNLPREFVAAAYRFGHSGVRTGYRLNAGINNRFSIFPASDDKTTKAGAESLLGFDPVTVNQVVDSWERFFPASKPGTLPTEDRSTPAGDPKDPKVRVQFAYKLDPTLVDPLGVLPRAQVAGEGTTEQAEAAIAPAHLPDTAVKPPRPSLALLNLLRGNSYRIQSGQAIAKALSDKGLPVTPLEPKFLVTRQPAEKDGFFEFKAISVELRHDTPLWFYILAEAQAPIVKELQAKQPFDETLLLTGVGAKTQLGWVGGRIVAEVFYGLLDADPESYVNAAPAGWKPILGGDKSVLVRNMLKVADSSNA